MVEFAARRNNYLVGQQVDEEWNLMHLQTIDGAISKTIFAISTRELVIFSENQDGSYDYQT